VVVSCVVAPQVVCFGIGSSKWTDGALLAMGEGRSVVIERLRLGRRALLLITSVSTWRLIGWEVPRVVDE
jgi:hypothetical protein